MEFIDVIADYVETEEYHKILEEKGLHFGMDVDKYLKSESS